MKAEDSFRQSMFIPLSCFQRMLLILQIEIELLHIFAACIIQKFCSEKQNNVFVCSIWDSGTKINGIQVSLNASENVTQPHIR